MDINCVTIYVLTVTAFIYLIILYDVQFPKASGNLRNNSSYSNNNKNNHQTNNNE